MPTLQPQRSFFNSTAYISTAFSRIYNFHSFNKTIASAASIFLKSSYFRVIMQLRFSTTFIKSITVIIKYRNTMKDLFRIGLTENNRQSRPEMMSNQASKTTCYPGLMCTWTSFSRWFKIHRHNGYPNKKNREKASFLILLGGR